MFFIIFLASSGEHGLIKIQVSEEGIGTWPPVKVRTLEHVLNINTSYLRRSVGAYVRYVTYP